MKRIRNAFIVLTFMLIAYAYAKTVGIYQAENINVKAENRGNEVETKQEKIEKDETEKENTVQERKTEEASVDENLLCELFRNDYIWQQQIYDKAIELAEDHGLYQFLDIGEPWISKEGYYCTYFIAEYSDSGVYLEAQSKENYELTYKDSVYTENFAGTDYRIIDFDRQKLAELEDIILRNGVNERCRLYSMEGEVALISTASGSYYSINMAEKTMTQTDSRGEGKVEEDKWDFHGVWGDSYQQVLENWTRMPEYEKEFADTVGGTVQYEPHLVNYIGEDLIYERYALNDLDKDGTPELILLSDHDNSMNAVFSYTDRLVYCGTYHNALYTDNGKIIERGHWWGGSVMVIEPWHITEFQGGKIVGEEGIWREYRDDEMKDIKYVRSFDGELTEISYEEYCNMLNAVLSKADFVRNMCSEKIQ